jgi:hypothetical protein
MIGLLDRVATAQAKEVLLGALPPPLRLLLPLQRSRANAPLRFFHAYAASRHPRLRP